MSSPQLLAVGVGELEIAASDAHSRLSRGIALLVDVREPEELEDGFVLGSVNIPLGDVSGQVGLLPADLDLLFFCRSGKRSLQATELARASGQERAYSVAGGMTAWFKAGLPVAR